MRQTERQTEREKRESHTSRQRGDTETDSKRRRQTGWLRDREETERERREPERH